MNLNKANIDALISSFVTLDDTRQEIVIKMVKQLCLDQAIDGNAEFVYHERKSPAENIRINSEECCERNKEKLDILERLLDPEHDGPLQTPEVLAAISLMLFRKHPEKCVQKNVSVKVDMKTLTPEEFVRKGCPNADWEEVLSLSEQFKGELAGI